MKRIAISMGAAWIAAGWAAAATEPPDLDGARWIWTADAPAGHAPAGTRYFRTSFVLPPEWDLDSGALTVTADNLFTLYLNGVRVAQRNENPNAWRQPLRVDLGSGGLQPGTNWLAAAAVNTAPGPAGLIAKLTVRAGVADRL